MAKSITYSNKGVSFPQGFFTNGIAAGIKSSGEKDLGLLTSEAPAKCAGTFTRNQFIAAPIAYSRDVVTNQKVTQAVLVNSGNANACTGQSGTAAVQQCIGALQKLLPFGSQPILQFSTGPIGVPFPAESVIQTFPGLVKGLGQRKDRAFAESMLTTDTHIKCRAAEFQVQGKTVRIGATAKGAGMIEPSMATMLCFITTDADLPTKLMSELLLQCVNESFNRISVDGDQSTNDSVVLLANGRSQVSITEPSGAAYELFAEALLRICRELAESIVADGEGATKLVRLQVTEAATTEEARAVCRQVVNGLLWKCALFGQSPNWGRIAAAAGSTTARINKDKFQISLQGKTCFKGGEPDVKARQELRKAMRGRDITIQIRLGAGEAAYSMLGNDISFDYVKINLN